MPSTPQIFAGVDDVLALQRAAIGQVILQRGDIAAVQLLNQVQSAGKAQFEEYERTIFEIQGKGYQVIIAHPERYRAIQDDIEIARRLVKMGCKLQASADFVAGGRLGAEKKPAKKIFEEGLYSYIASDAHCVEHYDYLARARKEFRTRGAHARL